MAADNNDLYLNPDAARACDTACNDYLRQLDKHKSTAKGLANVDGWGDFDSGRDLRTIFREKAMGGENNMVDVLEAHIQVVLEMQTVFQKFFVATDSVDHDNAAGLGDVGTNSPGR